MPVAFFEDLRGKVLVSAEQVEGSDGDRLEFKDSDGTEYYMQHFQDCCESVYIEDIEGELENILNSEILYAYKETSVGKEGEYGDSSTWTFYRIGTDKGSVVIRWFGTSNGYYSEGVDFCVVAKG